MMADDTQPGPVYRKPIEADWPEDELEHLGKCPVCGRVERAIAYSGLQDKVFFCAPGIWTSWRCSTCNVVYLDPRPTPESIGRAYETYYTHDTGGRSVSVKSGFIKTLRRIAPNSYLNKKFGYQLRPSLPFAALALEWQPRRALSTAHFYRHLPAPRQADDCLLDIGCGDGGFLQTARDQLGYKVEGLEIDPRAREAALRRGLTVHAASMPGSGLQPGSYYQVTLSHVLEHLHDPVGALREVFGLLRPRGRVWIAVPNMAAASLERFGTNSRLLEPPRHLVMFDTKSLATILGETGFKDITVLTAIETDFVFNQSMMMERGLDPYATDPSYIAEKIQVSTPSSPLKEDTAPEHSEIITLVGIKPE